MTLKPGDKVRTKYNTWTFVSMADRDRARLVPDLGPDKVIRVPVSLLSPAVA